MNRRSFLAGSMALPAGIWSSSQLNLHFQEEQRTPSLSLRSLRDQYRRDLFDDFLPFMEQHVIDHEYGGFMCDTGWDGTHADENKRTWYEGRGIWVYSFLYNHFGQDRKYLEVARRSLQFILRAQPSGKDAVWPRDLTRDGKPLTAGEIYGDLFVAEGLAEYSTATGEQNYWNLAKDIVLKCVGLYDQPDFRPGVGQSYLGPQARPFPGARAQGTWMVLLRVATQMLLLRADPDLEEIAARAVDAIMRRHYNPEFRLHNELLHHDLSRPTNEYGQLVYTGHCFETLWMVMAEALRRKDALLFDEAADRLRRHVEVSWDHIYGGVFQNLQNVENNVWVVDKELWPQAEVLMGAMQAAEHSRASWSRELFTRMFTYVQEKFPLRRYGSPLWMHASDRKVSFEAYTKLPKRVENYHHPRHLMLNLLSLERRIARGERDL